ncbi:MULTISPECIES: ABC transporter permease [Helcobacillus]|uniref:ABC-2 type transport system permease protein n=1 Tax=Helcobacillus massiliensis TaxID=521392 RepID=A0A839QSU5_9MICO|nr:MULTISPECIES: ABC transporter permease [Helcobacillus]MBB3023122.1 ABC-2 type transport system permease protein [Helcobacillus massiliensis]MCG7427633.1 ABC transporter permease [Helcobacillus sp. ACRRO]
MNRLTFIALTLKRLTADWVGLFFTIVLPVGMFIMFGALQPYGEMQAGHGNVSAHTMVSMALYGGATAAVAAAGMTVVERSSGWGRQLALTPLSGGDLLLARGADILVRVLLPVIAVNIAGLVTNADMPLDRWLAAAVLCAAAAIPFGFFGMIFGLLFRSDSAVSVAATSLVILAFASNMFMPLSEDLLAFARFTPLYGPSVLAHFPLSEGVQPTNGGALHEESLGFALVMTLVWFGVFAGICWALEHRQKGRA